MSHDQLFKDLLSAFFLDFLCLFFPTIADAIDPAAITLRSPEIFTDIPEGALRRADLIAEIRTLGGEPELVLVHTEIQRRRATSLAKRMWEYAAPKSALASIAG